MSRTSVVFPGTVFGRLTVRRDVGRTWGGAILWECDCSCGSTTRVSASELRANRVKSCGCYQRETAGARLAAYRKAQP